MMKRSKIICLAGLLVAMVGLAMPIGAQSVGGGLSFWVPESLYLGRGGSVGIESAVGSSVGFGDKLSLPFGIGYNKVFGLFPEGVAIGPEPTMWFIADTLHGFAMAQVRLAIGPIFVELFGGGAVVWNVTLEPLISNIESQIAGTGETVSFNGPPSIERGRYGYGWQAGGAIGPRLG